MPHPVLVVSWLPLSLHCAISRASFFFFTSEWQVKAKGLLVWWLNESLCIFFKPFPLHVVINRKQAEVGPPDDRGEVRGSQGALGLQEQQQTERKPPSASQRQERPQRSVYDVIAVHWHHCEPKRCSMCSGFFLQVTALNAKIFFLFFFNTGANQHSRQGI